MAVDIRFTTKPDALYAIVMGWPEGALNISSLTADALPNESIRSVRLLGHDGVLEWTQGETGLMIELPDMPSGDYAFSFNILYA